MYPSLHCALISYRSLPFTRVGMKEAHFRQVADFLHQAVTIALTLQATSGTSITK